MKRPLFASAFGAIALALTVQFGSFLRAEDKDDAKKDAKLTKALTKAREHLVKRDEFIAAGKTKEKESFKENDQFWALLQANFDKFPTVTPTKDEAKKYTKVTLNTHGAKLDAVTFKALGKEGEWDMNWEYVRPKDDKVKWYIGPKKGFMKQDEGFRTYATAENYEEKGADLPKDNVRYTQPFQGRLKAGEEYMLWFLFEKAEPVDLHVRITLTRPK